MVLCVEALINPEVSDFSIKLEDQIDITPNGYKISANIPLMIG